MASPTVTFRAFVTAFTDFLTVAIHTILYERSIYPRTSFLSARRYNLAVRQNRHPKVCEWINDAVNAIDAELLKGSVDRVAVVIHGKDHQVLERYVFDVSRFPLVSPPEADTPLRSADVDGEQREVLPPVDMEEEFRACMSQLTSSSSKLKPLPTGCSFTVAMELKDDGEAPIGHPQPWMPAQRDGDNDQGGTTTTIQPVRTAVAGDMVFETWIEQAQSQSDRRFTLQPVAASKMANMPS